MIYFYIIIIVLLAFYVDTLRTNKMEFNLTSEKEIVSKLKTVEKIRCIDWCEYEYITLADDNTLRTEDNEFFTPDDYLFHIPWTVVK